MFIYFFLCQLVNEGLSKLASVPSGGAAAAGGGGGGDGGGGAAAESAPAEEAKKEEEKEESDEVPYTIHKQKYLSLEFLT